MALLAVEKKLLPEAVLRIRWKVACRVGSDLQLLGVCEIERAHTLVEIAISLTTTAFL